MLRPDHLTLPPINSLIENDIYESAEEPFRVFNKVLVEIGANKSGQVVPRVRDVYAMNSSVKLGLKFFRELTEAKRARR